MEMISSQDCNFNIPKWETIRQSLGQNMYFSIEPSNGVAIYEQLVRQVKFAVADSTLKPGQLLPSIRILSQQLAINPNTITRAFQQLQTEGVLESLRGKGMAVCSDAKKSCVEARRELIDSRFRAVICEALHAGIDGANIRTLVDRQLRELDGHVETVAANPASAGSVSENSTSIEDASS